MIEGAVCAPVIDYGPILSRSAAYLLNTWYPSKGYLKTIPVLPNDEYGLRGAACAALTVSVADHIGVLDPATVNVAAARAMAARLIAAVARQHTVNGGTWGGGWQTGLWASIAGLAGWLGWQNLIPNDTERDGVARMVAAEATRLAAITPPVWTTKADVVVTPGDTKAEENSWNATVLGLAAVMLPDHPQAATWANAGQRYAISSYAVKGDLNLTTVVGGQGIAAWLAPVGGYNARPDYLVVNHNILHPDYATCVYQNMQVPLYYAIAGRRCSRAWVWNAARVYRAMQTVTVNGGTLYQAGKDLPYYPQGNDWGARRPVGYLPFDALTGYLGLDTDPWTGVPCPRPAAYWHSLHLRNVLAMQSRSVTATHPAGAIYDTSVSPVEDNYLASEEWASSMVALAALAQCYARQLVWLPDTAAQTTP